MVWWPELVANKVNKILLCLTETNKFIVVFQWELCIVYCVQCIVDCVYYMVHCVLCTV